MNNDFHRDTLQELNDAHAVFLELIDCRIEGRERFGEHGPEFLRHGQERFRARPPEADPLLDYSEAIFPLWVHTQAARKVLSPNLFDAEGIEKKICQMASLSPCLYSSTDGNADNGSASQFCTIHTVTPRSTSYGDVTGRTAQETGGILSEREQQNGF